MFPFVEFIIQSDEETSNRLQNATIEALSQASQSHDILVTVAHSVKNPALRFPSIVDRLIKASRADFVAIMSPGDFFSPESFNELISGVRLQPNASIITCRSEYFDGTVGQRLGPENGGALAPLEDCVFGVHDVKNEQSFRLFRQREISKVDWNPAATGLESEHYMFAIFSPATHVHLPNPVFHRRGDPDSARKIQPMSSQYINSSRAQAHNRIGFDEWSEKSTIGMPSPSSGKLPEDNLLRLTPSTYTNVLAIAHRLRESGHREVGLYVDSAHAWQWEFARRYNSFFDYLSLSTIALAPIIEPHTIQSTQVRYPAFAH